jgi:hypothetical protein
MWGRLAYTRQVQQILTFRSVTPALFQGSSRNTVRRLQPVGRSVYNALQLKLVENVTNPMRGMKTANFQVS